MSALDSAKRVAAILTELGYDAPDVGEPYHLAMPKLERALEAIRKRLMFAEQEAGRMMTDAEVFQAGYRLGIAEKRADEAERELAWVRDRDVFAARAEKAIECFAGERMTARQALAVTFDAVMEHLASHPPSGWKPPCPTSS